MPTSFHAFTLDGTFDNIPQSSITEYQSTDPQMSQALFQQKNKICRFNKEPRRDRQYRMG